jgi:hypothetical protein
LATLTACLGSQESSPVTRQFAEHSALAEIGTARSAPRRNCSPKAALLPVIGPPALMTISARAGVESSKQRNSERIMIYANL